jgi:hypothetical protein
MHQAGDAAQATVVASAVYCARPHASSRRRSPCHGGCKRRLLRPPTCIKPATQPLPRCCKRHLLRPPTCIKPATQPKPRWLQAPSTAPAHMQQAGGAAPATVLQAPSQRRARLPHPASATANQQLGTQSLGQQQLYTVEAGRARPCHWALYIIMDASPTAPHRRVGGGVHVQGRKQQSRQTTCAHEKGGNKAVREHDVYLTQTLGGGLR